jgi:hypothetical protein
VEDFESTNFKLLFHSLMDIALFGWIIWLAWHGSEKDLHEDTQMTWFDLEFQRAWIWVVMMDERLDMDG